MNLRPPEFIVDAASPFANDLLKRKAAADSLSNLVVESPEGIVLSLHSPWGTGKTTFLRMWRQQLTSQGVRSLLFSAWESDFTDDALVSLIGELEAGVKELRLSNDEGQRDAAVAAVAYVKKVGASILKRGLPIAARLGTGGLLDLDEFTEEALSDAAEKLAEEKIKSYEASRASLKGFRDAIADLAARITSTSDKAAPLVLIIDELDRCRPTYSLRLLECVKHLFAVPGVVFVIAMDRIQLGSAIASQYGERFDSLGYLRRFFDIELLLPEPETEEFAKAQFARYGLNEAFALRNGPNTTYDRGNIEEILTELFLATRSTLRDQERCFTLLTFAMKATTKTQLIEPLVLGTLIVVKVRAPELYKDFIQGFIGASEFIERFGRELGAKSFFESDKSDVLEGLLHAVACPRHDAEAVLGRYREVASNGADPVKKLRAATILRVLDDPRSRHSTFGALGRLSAKIDLVRS